MNVTQHSYRSEVDLSAMLALKQLCTTQENIYDRPTTSDGIVNLLKEWKSLQKRRTRERKEAEEEEWIMQRYAAVFVSVTRVSGLEAGL